MQWPPEESSRTRDSHYPSTEVDRHNFKLPVGNTPRMVLGGVLRMFAVATPELSRRNYPPHLREVGALIHELLRLFPRSL